MLPKNEILQIYLFFVHISDREWICEMLYVIQLRHITAGNLVQAVCASWHRVCFSLSLGTPWKIDIVHVEKTIHCVPSNESGR